MNSYPLLTPVPISGLGIHFRGDVATPIVNVRDKGAKGDGKTNDTAAFQAAVDDVPLTGGTVIVPRGDYRIDVTKAIVLHSNMLFLMDPAATLAAIPTDSGRYWVIKVWEVDNVRIVGGTIVGERTGHQGTTGEQGYGINIQSSTNVMVSDINIRNCWGDGMWIGALGADGQAVPAVNVMVNRVVSTNNRRQGLSIGPAENVVIMNSTFSGSDGTNPKAGIDIEPQRQGFTRNITISHCIMTRNRGCGMEVHGNVIGLSVDNCVFNDNFGYGVLTNEEHDMNEKEPTGLTFSNNTFTRNGLVGALIAGHSNYVHIAHNTMVGNGFRYPLNPGDDPDRDWWTRHDAGISAPGDAEHSVEPELLIREAASNVTVRDNTFT
ncbi:right-handed parallel beta-helix repeat-containing protein [Dyella humi]|uniref:Right-handed parallel beta-helix repeat-containing protein n=1 Tax=Dyella humi TaxID=1770547 RepID=A0ABW8IDP1_9GAMM